MANMVANTKLWMTVGGASITSIATALYMAWNPHLQIMSGMNRAGSTWRLLAIAFAILNIKSLPFAWHIRILYGFFIHYFPPAQIKNGNGPSLLFQPIITSSRTTILECDYNIHKSNSTYFSDLDMSRMHLISCIGREGLTKLNLQLAKEGRRRLGVMLGGVTCNFRKEIKPYEAYEIWTRVLAWDRKWLYLVSHIVKSGAAAPKGYSLQPWKNTPKIRRPEKLEGTATHPAILATSIAKYVFKEGRLTIPPEIVLQVSELLPPKPGDWEQDPHARSLPDSMIASNGSLTSGLQGEKGVPSEQSVEVSLRPDETAVWDWKRVEDERQRGMQLAEFMAGLDGLDGVFTGDSGSALGQF